MRRMSILMLSAFLLAACAPGSGPFRDYFVSTDGNDRPGCGAESDPCRTIQYTLDNADYSRDDVHVRVAAGLYDENLSITRSVKITGAGTSDGIFDPGVTAIRPTRIAGATEPLQVINESQVELRDLMFEFGRVQQTGGTLYAENVSFYFINRLNGLELINVAAFNIVNCHFHTAAGGRGDVGLNIINSIGEVHGGVWEAGWDHGISATRYPDGSPALETIGDIPTTVLIDGVTIHGSPIFYADGIRVFGRSNVDILNSTIVRETAGAEPWPGSGSDSAAAGIQFQWEEAGDTGNTSITNIIRGNTISGFDVGIQLDTGGMKFLGEDNMMIAGITHGLQTDTKNLTGGGRTDLLVDFGGGPLGSTGGNTFSNGGDFGAYHQETYPVYACFNEWQVPEDQIDPLRIWDELDDASLGRVLWDCSELSLDDPDLTLITVTPTPGQGGDQPGTVTITTTTPCYLGPGPQYGLVNNLPSNTSAELVGAGFTGSGNQDWLIARHPNTDDTNCWLDSDDVTPSIPFSEMRLITVPGLPTPTPRPTSDRPAPEDTPVPCYYNANNLLICP